MKPGVGGDSGPTCPCGCGHVVMSPRWKHDESSRWLLDLPPDGAHTDMMISHTEGGGRRRNAGRNHPTDPSPALVRLESPEVTWGGPEEELGSEVSCFLPEGQLFRLLCCSPAGVLLLTAWIQSVQTNFTVATPTATPPTHQWGRTTAQQHIPGISLATTFPKQLQLAANVEAGDPPPSLIRLPSNRRLWQ